jgi:Tol biopolymer transport system component
VFCTICAQPNPPGTHACLGCGAALPARPGQSPRRMGGIRRALVWLIPALLVAASLAALAGSREASQRERAALAASALRAGDLAALPLDAPETPAVTALASAMDDNRRLREQAIALLARGDTAGAMATLRTALAQLPGDAETRDLLETTRQADIERHRLDLERATAVGDSLATERAARELAALLDGSPESVQLRELAEHSAPIALARDSALWLVAPDGGNGRMLTDNVPVARPIWDPQRTRLAFVSSDFLGGGVAADLFVIDADGANLRTFYETAHPNAIPSWSPDGRSIALTSVAEWSLTTESGRLTIHAIPAEGAGKTIDLGANLGAHATTPAWSPDGDAIAFISRPFQQDPTQSVLSGPATVMLWSDDGTLRNLSGAALPGANRLLWSQDGRDLIVLSREAAGSEATTGVFSSISIIDRATGTIRPIAGSIPASSSGWGPAGSPDGERIAWVAGARTVIVRDRLGEEQVIDTGRVLSGALTWSPGGTELLAASAEGGRPSARIRFGPEIAIEDIPLRYDLEWPTGTPQWSPVLSPGDGSLVTVPGGTGLDW